MMSIRWLNICGDSIYKPLRLLFRASLDQGTFPLCWKKANVAPIHKKTTIVFQHAGKFLISQNQSEFKPGDSSTSSCQLIMKFINHLMIVGK